VTFKDSTATRVMEGIVISQWLLQPGFTSLDREFLVIGFLTLLPKVRDLKA